MSEPDSAFATALDPRPGRSPRGDRGAGVAPFRPLRRDDVHRAGMDRRLPMRRFLTDVWRYLRELGAAVRGGWNAFFFSPADPTALGLIRIAFGLLMFWSLLVFGLDLHDYLGSEGWAEPSAIRMAQRPLVWSFWFLVPDAWLRLTWLGCLGILVLYTLGLFSRGT